jgi:hypothetical protein
MPEMSGCFIAVRDEKGLTQIAGVLGHNDRMDRDGRVSEVIWQIETYTGPWSLLATGKHYVFEVSDADLASAIGLSADDAARHVQGWASARGLATAEGHGFYDGVVLRDEARESVRHLDRGVAREMRVAGQGMEQSW